MTRDEFIAGYCERSKVTWEWLSQRVDAIPCNCGEEGCRGWQMLHHESIALDAAFAIKLNPLPNDDAKGAG